MFTSAHGKKNIKTAAVQKPFSEKFVDVTFLIYHVIFRKKKFAKKRIL